MGIKVAVCVDDKLGMLFFGKRQSRDRVLIEELIEYAEGRKIYINSFSKLLFPNDETVKVCEDPLAEAKDGDVCFIENLPLAPHTGKISTLIIYRWNRAYPTDKKLDVSPSAHGFKLISVKEFAGSSHEKITKEIYER